MRIATAAVAGIAALGIGLGLGGCGGGGSAPASHPQAVPTHAQATLTAPAVNYKSQYLADIAPANAASSKIPSSATITSPSVVAYGTVASATARKLLQQNWPANAQADVHTAAIAAETISADIQTGNLAKLASDVTVLKADTQVVRADLGLPAK